MSSILFYFTIFLLLILTSCDQHTPSSNWQLIAGRNFDTSLDRPMLYRALVPAQWIRQDPPANESLMDTTRSICEYYIRENQQTIRLTIHTFPVLPNSIRIPPQAQTARWKKQFDTLDPLATHSQADSHGGFCGLFFEGQGILHGELTKVMGWSMQLASCYDQQLCQSSQPVDCCKRADYTIKVSGPPAFMDQHRADILAFAQSFELIEELPSPL